MVILIAAFAAGVIFGAVVMCCCIIAGRADRDADDIMGYES